MSNRRWAMQFLGRQLSLGILKTRKSILRRISPLQQPLHLHYDPKQWVSLVEYSFMFSQKVTRQWTDADQTEPSSLHSCYCISGEEENCSNKEWLDAWKDVKLERESSVATTTQAVEEMEAIPLDTAVRVADLAAKDSVVAIAAADNPDYDY